MTFLPIVERELRVASRRHGTYTTRLIVGLAAIVIGIFLYLASIHVPKSRVAHNIFEGLAVFALLYCLAAGRRFTADCLSEEKREGTLGLLFLTSLRGYDVVLGKLAATSLNGFFALLAIFPVMAVPLLMGGITNGEFWRMVLVLLDTFLFSLAVGVFASALSWNPRHAMGSNFLWLLLLAGALPACAGTIAYFSPTHMFVTQMLYTCPGFTFYLVSDTNYRFHAAEFWSSAAVIHILTWALVALASLRVPRSWQEHPTDSVRKLNWRELWHRWTYGKPARRNRLRRRLLQINPIYWLASRAWFKPLGVWLALVFVAAWWIFMSVVLHFNWFDELLCFSTVILLNSLLKLWIAVEAGQRLAEDQKVGSMELLLSTPLRVIDIIRGQWLALARQFLRPLILVFAVQLLLLCFAPSQAFQIDNRMRAFGAAAVVMLATDLAAIVWVAMAAALTSKTANHASVSTVFRIMILPWVIWMVVVTLTNLWVVAFGGETFGWKFYLGLWVVLGIAADLLFGLPAWWKLQTRFRELALRRVTR